MNEDGTDSEYFIFTLKLNKNRYLTCLNHIQCANTVAVPLVLDNVCTFCSKPTCFCERIAVQTLDVPRFIEWL